MECWILNTPVLWYLPNSISETQPETKTTSISLARGKLRLRLSVRPNRWPEAIGNTSEM